MKQDIHPTLDFDEVVDGLYVGTNQCCQTHFDERLIGIGIEADISLEEERLDSPLGVHFYLWLPVKDHRAPSQGQLEVGVAALRKLVKLGRKVYIHCKNGHGRSPTLLAAYLIAKGMSVDQAIKLIKGKRPAIHLEEVQRRVLDGFSNKTEWPQ